MTPKLGTVTLSAGHCTGLFNNTCGGVFGCQRVPLISAIKSVGG